MSDGLRYAGVFVLIVVVMAGIAAAGALVTVDDPSTPVDATVDHDHYSSEELLEDAAIDRGEGEIVFDSNGERTVLIHNAGNSENIEPIVEALATHGHEVRFYGDDTTGDMPPVVPPMIETNAETDFATDAEVKPGEEPAELEAALGEADAFLIVGTADQFADDEIDAIEEFVEADGRVLLADDATTGFGDSAELTSRFGLHFGDGYLYNMYENDANFQSIYAEAGQSALADGADRIVTHQAVPISSADATPVATGLEKTKHSSTRESGEYHVAVQADNVVAIGDTSLFSSANYNRADNEVLIGNVLEFLTSGQSNYDPVGGEQELPEEPPEEEFSMPEDELDEERVE